MLLIGSNGLIATYFFGAFSASRDSLIKVGSLIAGIGLGFNVLISILQMAGVYVFVLALLGALVMMAGVVIACIKFIMLFQRDAFVVVFCVFIFLGLLLSLFWTWASLISGAGLGGPADLFLRPQYHLLDSFSHSGYFLVYRGCTVWLR